MAYRKTFLIRGLPRSTPKVSDENYNAVSDCLFRSRKRLTLSQLKRGFPATFHSCTAWQAYLYQRIFKGVGEFCPIDADHFMVRFVGKYSADSAVKALETLMEETKGLNIDIETGG
jgi:hypothetical protein